MASVTGTNEAGASVRAYLRNYVSPNQLVATATANGSGNWSVALTQSAADTDYLIVVYSEDGVTHRYSVVVPAGVGPFAVSSILGTARPETPEPIPFIDTNDLAVALNDYVLKATAIFNVKNFGALGNNTGNDAPAIQSAITASVAAGGGQIYFPPGIYRVTSPVQLKNNLTFVGAGGTASRIHGTNGTFVTVSPGANKVTFEDIYISAQSGHVFDTSVGGLYQSEFSRCALYQSGVNHSIWSHLGAATLIENRFDGCDFWITSGATVPGFVVVGTAGNIAGQEFSNCRFNGGGNTTVPFLSVTENSTTYGYDWMFRNISIEQVGGGFLKAYSVQGWKLDGIYCWDQATLADDGIYFGQAASAIKSRRIAVERYFRRGGTLNSGKFDVNLDPIGVTGSGCIVLNISTSTATPASVNVPPGCISIAGGGITDTYAPADGAPASGDDSFSRRQINTNQVGAASGTMLLTHWNSKKTFTCPGFTLYTGNTAASGLTLARVGLYTVDDNDNLTLVASNANDLTMFTSTGQVYTRTFSSQVSIIRGQRYALGILQVGTTPATFYGILLGASTTATTTISLVKPVIISRVTGQTDLPNSPLVGSLTGINSGAYVLLNSV